MGHFVIILFIRNSLLTNLFKLSCIKHVAIFRGIQLRDIRKRHFSVDKAVILTEHRQAFVDGFDLLERSIACEVCHGGVAVVDVGFGGRVSTRVRNLLDLEMHALFFKSFAAADLLHRRGERRHLAGFGLDGF
jgi:hypothetical protein